MKPKTFTMPLDTLGRVVIPMAIRRPMGLRGGSHLEITVRHGSVILEPTRDRCVFLAPTHSAELIGFGEHFVCRSCIDGLASAELT